jgi:succinate dehydrogenase flavin-adding protein (antitoxin of CptAB toxin-antitoxin module)
MEAESELDYLSRRAQWLCRRSLLELELVIDEFLRNELPDKVKANDVRWLGNLIKILELDDFVLLEAISDKKVLAEDYDTEIISLLQSYVPGKLGID